MKNSCQEQEVHKIKIHKRLLSLLVVASIGIGSYVLINPFHQNEKGITGSAMSEPSDNKLPELEDETIPTVPPTVEPKPEISDSFVDSVNQGDSVVTTTKVNLRINNNTDAYKLGVLPQGTIVNRILSIDDNWDLVRYNDTIAYICSDYVQKADVDYNNEYYKVEDYNDIVRTTTEVYFRLGPDVKEKEIGLLNKNEELVVIGKATINLEPDNVWYIAKARGKIGFVKAEYTKSLRSILESNISGINDIKVQKLGYLTKETPIYDNAWNIISSGETYQLVQVLDKIDSYYLVNIDGKIGYIANENVRDIKGSFLVVDISDQTVSYYCNTDIVFQSDCTTGKKETPTEKGVFEPYSKASFHNFGPSHNNVEAKILWMPFNGGQGFHDAPWEAASKFGSYDYAMNYGSAGCVRLPDEAARFIYKNVPKSTKILIKQ